MSALSCHISAWWALLLGRQSRRMDVILENLHKLRSAHRHEAFLSYDLRIF